MNWQDFLPQARAIVEEAKRKYPGAEHAFLGGAGGSDSKFSRKGTGYHYRYYDTPAEISDLIMSNARTAGMDSGLASLQNQAYTRLMQETATGTPGYSQLSKVSEIDPSQYAGKDALDSVAARNPYGGAFEGETYDAFVQRAADALAGVTTGPSAVRGGDARPALAQGTMSTRLAAERGAEVRAAQQQDVGNVMNAALGSGQLESQRYGLVRDGSLGLSQLASGVAERVLGAARSLDANKLNNLNLLQLAASLQGTTTDKQVDDFSGRGDQSGWQGGLSCCFIMYAACRGDSLPWTIELARQELWTPRRRRGYGKMARWLVPLQKRFKWVNKVVNFVLVRPAIRHCEWMYGGKPHSVVDELVSRAWLGWWSLTGGH